VLESRGFERTKMSTMPRGIDGATFRPMPDARHTVCERYGVPDGLTLCYVGRIACDKSVDFVIDVYERLRAERDDVNLLIVGDGPDLGALRMRLARYERVVFAGRVERERLPEMYSATDLFLFPSSTDTFGMAVLEAQACGVPALVSDEGGPKDIIVDGTTGYVLAGHDPDEWVRRIQEFTHMVSRDPGAHAAMRRAARANVVTRFSWQRVLQELFDNPLTGLKHASHIWKLHPKRGSCPDTVAGDGHPPGQGLTPAAGVCGSTCQRPDGTRATGAVART
jgi:glycosyltransferase involved in cell wall biosynthesis